MNSAAKSEFPKVLQESLRSGVVWDESGGKIPLDSNVSASEALELHHAVRELRPQRSLEVGLAKGISTLAILGALEKNGCGHHVVMDPFQENFGNAGIEMVRRAGLDKWWEFHRNFAEEVIPGLDPIQFAFIDASHLFDLTLMEFVLVDKKLEVGGVVALHDMWMPSLQSVYRFIMRNRSYRIFFSDTNGTPAKAVKNQTTWKQRFRSLVRLIPHGEVFFSPEFLDPWGETGLSNLIFLQKHAPDNRDWRFHQSF